MGIGSVVRWTKDTAYAALACAIIGAATYPQYNVPINAYEKGIRAKAQVLKNYSEEYKELETAVKEVEKRLQKFEQGSTLEKIEEMAKNPGDAYSYTRDYSRPDLGAYASRKTLDGFKYGAGIGLGLRVLGLLLKREKKPKK